MKILAIVAYAGSEKLVEMAENMLQLFSNCVSFADADVFIAAVNNNAERDIDHDLVDFHYWKETNEGFGCAVNTAITKTLADPIGFTHVLVLNSDLEFPDVTWLRALLAEVGAHGDLVLSPCTDITATTGATAKEAIDQPPVRLPQISAFCWLVPATVLRRLRAKFGITLFHPEFSNYGSDDVTAACLRHFDKRPFLAVRRSWVKHLKGQTANELGIRGGTPELLQRIGAYKRAHKLT